MNRREVLTTAAASLATSAFGPLPALAQGRYPERPIRMMVPFAAGGVVDVVGRQWAERVRPHLGSIVFFFCANP